MVGDIIVENNIRMFINQFKDLCSMDEKEIKFKEVLEYLLTQPAFVRGNRRFHRVVLDRIRRNQLIRHFHMTGNNLILEDVENWELINDSPIINYNYYYHHIKHI